MTASIDFDAIAADMLAREERLQSYTPEPEEPEEPREEDERADDEAEERDDLTADGRRGYDGRYDEGGEA